MTNEIKEILECMSKVAFHEVGMQLETEQVKTLLDYITNLQETHCEYKEKCNEYNVGCIKEILCNSQNQIIDLRKRINKAIEYIENKTCELDICFGSEDWHLTTVKKLLKILRGEE